MCLHKPNEAIDICIRCNNKEKGRYYRKIRLKRNRIFICNKCLLDIKEKGLWKLN